MKLLFEIADRKRPRAAGDQLPGCGPFRVFRGVAGRGRARRVRGISWTGSLVRAAWFACRFAQQANRSSLVDPTVYTTTVNESDVLTYCNDPEGAGRGEEEFLVLLPKDAPIARVQCDVRALARQASGRAPRRSWRSSV